ncbi:MAG: hypothetical protein ACQETB_02160 [Halobacteriota archaeon]
MPGEQSPGVFGADTDSIVASLREACDGTLYVVVEYDADSYEAVYVSDAMRSYYDDEAAMYDHFDRIHSYIHVDFAEIDLFTDTLFPIADDVEYIATSLDFIKLVRIYDGTGGVFVTVDPEEPIVDLVAAVRELTSG